ncbi:L-asparaginase [Spinactinospora alkalitolerans]|uniref:L-asparaginase n=1 Tax=Spinactinospora alkalitolerans TaxID=687207 RepID=A0A852TT06_9ACTN|nr:asparaginase [Spinactinospora alkalitolerans]NYE47149.1 L-asparaginase [Spinactinospora alkalitolerans]
MQPLLKIITLGGTIMSVSDENGHAHPRLSGTELVRSVNGLTHVDVESVDPIPSADITMEVILDLAARIERARADGYSGVVIAQGTDTLEETAFALDLLVRPGIAVVVTGAMRHASMPGTDGPANLVDAVRTAATEGAEHHGVLVAIGNAVHFAREVRKVHTQWINAFQSTDIGPAGTIAERRIVLRPRSYTRPLLDAARLTKPIKPAALVTLGMDDDGWWLSSAAQTSALVVAALGGGHIPTRLSERITRLAQSIPVVLASRTGSGHMLTETYGGFAGAEVELLGAGLVSAGSLDGLKSRIALTLLTASGMDTEENRRDQAVLRQTQRGTAELRTLPETRGPDAVAGAHGAVQLR